MQPDQLIGDDDPTVPGVGVDLADRGARGASANTAGFTSIFGPEILWHSQATLPLSVNKFIRILAPRGHDDQLIRDILRDGGAALSLPVHRMLAKGKRLDIEIESFLCGGTQNELRNNILPNA